MKAAFQGGLFYAGCIPNQTDPTTSKRTTTTTPFRENFYIALSGQRHRSEGAAYPPRKMSAENGWFRGPFSTSLSLLYDRDSD
jgi:hypothetical protein